MADIETLMGVSATDIEKVMGVSAGDIESVMGVGLVTSNAWQGTRALGYGQAHESPEGSTLNSTDRILYKTMASGATTSDFGNLEEFSNYVSGVQGGGRCMFAGIYEKTNGSLAITNRMQYITVGSTGNATDAGDLTKAVANVVGNGGGSNGTTGLIVHGYNSSWGLSNEAEYFTISSTGNASAGGDRTVSRASNGMGNSTRIFLIMGYDGSAPRSNIIDAMTYASPTSDASDWGDAFTGNNCPAEGDESRGIIFPSYTDGTTASGAFSNVYIHYFSLASTSNASEFGYGVLKDCDDADESWYPDGIDSTVSSSTPHKFAKHDGPVMSDGTRCEQWSGETYTGSTNNGSGHNNACGKLGDKDIFYITIQSTGNAADSGYDVGDHGDTFARFSDGAGCTGT